MNKLAIVIANCIIAGLVAYLVYKGSNSYLAFAAFLFWGKPRLLPKD